jgi:hypothetical protein
MWLASPSKDYTKGYLLGAKVEAETYKAWLECHGYKGPYPEDSFEKIHNLTGCECHKPKEKPDGLEKDVRK